MRGEISIGKVTSGGHKWINITVTDDKSGCQFLDLKMSLIAFAEAMTGSSDQDCEFELRTQNVGKRYEHKTMKILFPHGQSDSKDRDNKAKLAVHPYEIDGWMGDWKDLLNHHNWRKGDIYVVRFHRYVEEKDGEA